MRKNVRCKVKGNQATIPSFSKFSFRHYQVLSKKCPLYCERSVSICQTARDPSARKICLNEQELSLIRHKMNQLGTRNFGAYARKMLIDGYIIKVDYTEQKKLAAAVSRVASNINQICRRINSTGHFYDADIAELKERMADVWELLKVQQRNEL